MKDPFQKEDQRDLFDASEAHSTAGQVKKVLRSKPNPVFVVSLEQLIVFAIILILLCVLIFMIGMVKGKSSKNPENTSFEPQRSSSYHPVGTGDRAVQPVREDPVPYRVVLPARSSDTMSPSQQRTNAVEISPEKPYTIQVVAFRDEDRALRETAVLRAKGFQTQLLIRSGFHQVCVGNYSGRKDAQKDLKALRVTYKDCFIRKL